MAAFTTSVKRALSRYVDFAGRAPRAEFWWWILFTLLVQLATQTLDAAIFGTGPDAGQPISMLVSLGILLPNIAVAIRRLHDTGRTGWWLLIALVPVLGILVLIYFYIQPSEEGDNAYGPPDPLPAA